MRFMGSSAFTKWLITAISVLSFFPASALAADAAGRFTLTKEVHWGAIVLAPGDYTYSLEHRGSTVVLLRSASGQPGFLVMARSVDTVDTESDRLVLQLHGDQWFVSEMVVGSVGEELSFRTPEVHTETARKTRLGADKLASLSKP